MSKQPSIQREERALKRKRKMLLKAKRLIEKGFAIFPVGYKSKKPATSNGFKDATKDYPKFKKMVEHLDNFNIGIRTGRESGFFALDVDPRNGGHEAINALMANNKKLSPTVKVLTSDGGYHLYYKTEGEYPKKSKLTNGIDIIGEGGYILAAGSMHPSGVTYKYVKGKSLFEREISEVDKWFLKIALKKSSKNNTATSEAQTSTNAQVLVDGTIVHEKVAEGDRNNYLTKYAGQLRSKGIAHEEMLPLLKRANELICFPQLDMSEVETIAKSIASYPLNQPFVSQDLSEILASKFLALNFNDGKHLILGEDDNFYSYDGKIWRSIKRAQLEKQLLRLSATIPGASSKKTLVTNAMFYIVLYSIVDQGQDPLYFTKEPPNVINLQNGELWYNPDGTYTLKPHCYTSGLRSILSIEHDPNAKCPEFDRALLEIFAKAKRPKTLRKFIYQLFGYCLQHKRNHAMIVLFLGAGSNGKSKLTEVLTALVGEEYVQSTRLSQLEGQFFMKSLEGKRVLIDDDMDASSKLPDGILKTISESKLITTDVKYKSALSFKSRIVPILLGNNPPSLNDLSHGIMRRLKIVEFKRIFTSKEVDIDLFTRIIANELPGVLNRALEGYSSFVKAGGFVKSIDMNAALKSYRSTANPLEAFIEDSCVIDSTKSVPMVDFYREYLSWCQDSGVKRHATRLKLKQQMKLLGYGLSRNKKQQLLRGICLTMNQ